MMPTTSDAQVDSSLLGAALTTWIKSLSGAEEPIRQGLGLLGKSLGFDRVGLILFSVDGLMAKTAVYWNSETWIYDQSAQFYSLVEFPWLMRQLRNGQTVSIANVDEIPDNAFSENEYCKSHGIRRFIAMPLFHDDNKGAAGFLHLDATTSNDTPVDDASRVPLIGLAQSLMFILHTREKLADCHSLIIEKDILLNNTDVQMWYMLNATTYGAANEAHARFFGKTCFEMMRSEIYSAFNINDGNAFAEITLDVFEKKLPIRRELTIKNAQDQERVLLISWNPMFYDEPEVSHVVCSAQDITDLKKTQELAAANQKLTALNEEFMAVNAELLATNQALQREIGERKLAEERLENALYELKNAQSQIIQQEKMASIGQLAAGVAHEINNPMGFIISNLASLKKYTDKITVFLAAQDAALSELSQVCTHEAVKEKALPFFQQIQQAKRAQKIDYILSDTGDVIHETQEGAERVKKIVQDLKGFARISNDDTMLTDINAGLESTLNIIGNELKFKTTLHKEFGDIPLTKCNPGQLNQVFMNIILNAAQAIDTQGEISIKTWSDPAYIHVSIADTGCGMPPEVISRIFDPFFTTKEVGKGTGLGLNVSYEIIKKHGGEILVDSAVGIGTTFTVNIPLETFA